MKLAGWAGLAGALPLRKAFAAAETGAAGPRASGGCTLVPSETLGPFPLDLTANQFYFRRDVRESRTGAELRLKMRILGADNCGPMANVRVHIWHCDKDGVYSGYATPQNPGGRADTTWLRGYQITDANGEVEFITVHPGWYDGRVCHIHFQVYVSSAYSTVSQLTWNQAGTNAIYAAHPSLYTKGPDPMTPQSDGIFRNGWDGLQSASLNPRAGGGYESFLEVSVRGNGTVGLGHAEMVNARHFNLGQNYPNPFRGATRVPFTLVRPAEVTLALHNLQGQRVAFLARKGLAAGAHAFDLDLQALGLRQANYLYQIEVANDAGTFREYKLMTAGRGN